MADTDFQTSDISPSFKAVDSGAGLVPYVAVYTAPVGAGGFATGQVAGGIGVAATLIAAARIGAPGTGRTSITIVNNSTTQIEIGGPGVTVANGLILPGVVGAAVTIATTAAVYGIVASGTAAASFIEVF